MRIAYEDLTKTVQEELTTANNLRRVKNELLRDFISIRRDNEEYIETKKKYRK